MWKVKVSKKIQQAEVQNKGEAVKLCRAEGAEIPVLFRDWMKQA